MGRALHLVCATMMVAVAQMPCHAEGNVERPLWLDAGGAEPPRIYLFWQGPDLHTEPWATHARTVKPDLLYGGPLPHQSMRPAPEAERDGLWSYEPGEVHFEAPKGPTFFTTSDYRGLLERAAAEGRYITEEIGAWGACPYVCAVKINGEHERRYGFWAFYDHWEELEQWFGPKPATDPWDWVVWRADYNAKSVWSFYKPAKDGSTTHSGCPNSPFSEYLARFTGLVAAGGARGIFVDNPGTNCICRWCQDQWQQYLRERFSPEQMRRYFGVERYEDAVLYQEPFRIETARFWSRSVGRHLARMRQAGERVWGRGNFWVVPNGTALSYAPIGTAGNVVEWAAAGGFQLGSYENIRQHWGTRRQQLTPAVHFNDTRDLIMAHKRAHGMASGPTWAAPLRACNNDDGFRDLHFAEAMAFDGCLMDGGYAHEVDLAKRLELYTFTRHFQELLRTGEHLADVGVVLMTNELTWEPADSVREAAAVTDWLSEARVQWAAILDDNVLPATLARYRVVFVPNQRMLEDEQALALVDYARGGGVLVLSGECATRYLCGAARPEPALARICPPVPAGEPFAVAAVGSGRVAFCPRGFADLDVPAAYRGSDAQGSQPARGLIRETNRAHFLRCLDEAARVGLSSILAPGPRATRIASRWFPTDEGALLAVHLANYDLTVDVADKSYYIVTLSPSVQHPAAPSRVVTRVPEGWHARSLTWISYPSLERAPLQFIALADGVAFTAPGFTSYGLAAVELARGAAEATGTVDELRGAHTSAEGTLPALETQAAALRWRYAAETPAAADQPISTVAGVPVITSAAAGGTLELHLHGDADQGELRWDPYTLGEEWSMDAGVSNWLRFWVIGPAGGIVASGALPGGRAATLQVPAAESGLYVLMTEPGAGQLRVSAPGRCLMALGKPMRFSDLQTTLHFLVPAGMTQFQLAASSSSMQYAGRFEVLDPDGNVVLASEEVNVHGKIHTVAVPHGADGRVWSYRFTTDRSQTVSVDLLGDLPGYVSPDPARLAVFED
ncbi:MAG: hypothetical protein AB7Y46_10290 [Armatimonadota bacterium]